MTAKELAARLSLPESLQQQVFSIPIPLRRNRNGMSCFFAIKKPLNCVCTVILHRNSWLWHFICAGPLRPIAAISPLGFQKLSFGIHFKILRSGAKSACVSLANQD